MRSMMSLLAFVLYLLSCPSQAVPLVTPEGIIDIGRFDMEGNAVAQAAFTDRVTIYSQGRVSALYSPSGVPLTDTGLGRSFEITYLSGFAETPSVAPAGEQLAFALDPTSPVNYFQIFLDPSRDADPLRGTGFANGVPIMSGRVTQLLAVFGFAPSVSELDLFQRNDFPGILSLAGAGVDTVMLAVEAANAALFPQGIPGELLGLVPNGFPFTFIDPALQYQTPGGVQRADIGTINGLDGPDLVLQARFVLSFAPVPAPAPSALLVPGLLGIWAARRRRARGDGGQQRFPAPL